MEYLLAKPNPVVILMKPHKIKNKKAHENSHGQKMTNIAYMNKFLSQGALQVKKKTEPKAPFKKLIR